MGTVPNVVDHNKHAAIGQEFLKSVDRGIDGFKGLTLAGEGMDQVDDTTGKFARILT